jgi:hypothetical protein
MDFQAPPRGGAEALSLFNSGADNDNNKLLKQTNKHNNIHLGEKERNKK